MSEEAVPDAVPPEVRYAEYPERKCRRAQAPDGFNDHFCDLKELHPGPCCPKTLRGAEGRRLAWEAANPGWEKLAKDDDPFAGVEGVK